MLQAIISDPYSQTALMWLSHASEHYAAKLATLPSSLFHINYFNEVLAHTQFF